MNKKYQTRYAGFLNRDFAKCGKPNQKQTFHTENQATDKPKKTFKDVVFDVEHE
jgi:hypothetical protein